MTLQDKRIEWKTRYDAWKESEQSIAKWCRDQEVNVHQMYYWVKRFENDQASPELKPTQWMTVQVDNGALSLEGQESITIHVGAITVEVRPRTDVLYYTISCMSCRTKVDELSI